MLTLSTLTDLSEVEDRRRGQGRMYDLPHVVLYCILAVAAGADSYRAIVRFIDVRLGWLQQHTTLAWRRAPSHTGLRAILLGLDQPALEQALRRRAKAALAAEVAPASIAIDGKRLCAAAWSASPMWRRCSGCCQHRITFRLFLGSCDTAQFGCSTRMRSRSSLARPYIWRLRYLSRLTWPSTWPLLQGELKAARTAERSASSPAAKRLSSVTAQDRA